MARPLALVLLCSVVSGLSFEKVKNVRRLKGVASTLPIFRAASLDNATEADVAALRALGGLRLGCVIDLRNDDEVSKGAQTRSDASAAFYADAPSVFVQRPLLRDVDAFWAAVSEEAPPLVWERFTALWSARPLNAALSRALEDGGLAMLYKAVLASAPQMVGKAVRDCIDSAELGEAVVFHCQKGKDRTGIIAALLEEICGVPRADILASYAESGANLGGEDAMPPTRRKTGDDGDADAKLDWSRFRGSPPSAMDVTLKWLDATQGGASAYLSRRCGVGESRQAALRRCLLPEALPEALP